MTDSYKILFKRSAEKELRAISQPHLSKILQKIDSLSSHPRPHGAELLKGNDKYMRIRQGDYRIVYEVSNSDREIIIFKIGHRREVYR